MKNRIFPQLVGISFFCSIGLHAADPGWWTTRNVLNSSSASNLSPATIGQGKHVVSKALVEMQSRLSTQDYQALETEVAAIVNLAVPQTQSQFDDQKQILMCGQLKAMAKPFYDRLKSLNPSWMKSQMYQAGTRIAEPGVTPLTYSPYPWTNSLTDDSNYSPATVGQLKAVFSLKFENWGVADPLDPPLPTGTVDTDGDGLSDVTEAAMGTSPLLTDSDGDGVNDALDAFPLDSSRSTAPTYSSSDFSPPLIVLLSPTSAVYVSGP